MKNILKVTFVIIGTLIGAGFASGQEIYLFFFSYGLKGILGILVSSSIIGIVVYQTLKIIVENPIDTYKDFLETLLKKYKNHKCKQLRDIINIIINLFIVITFFIMIAGFGAYLQQEYGINQMIGSSLLAFACFMILVTSQKGLVKVNEILVPILILFIVMIGGMNLLQLDILKIGNYIIASNSGNWLLSAILYSSYNSILLIPVLITLKNYIVNHKTITRISVLTAFIIMLLSTLLYMLLMQVKVNIANLEMPIVYVVANLFPMLKQIYGFIILASIFTTSISLATSFLQNTTRNSRSYFAISLSICTISIFIANIGFAKLVNLLYPIFGYLGILQIMLEMVTVHR